MDEKQIKSKVADGYLYVRIILEIVGKPKEHVEESLKEYVKKIKADKEYNIIKEKSEKAEKLENGLFSAFSELEMLMKDPAALLNFCFDYLPSSIEVVEPERIMLKNSDFSDFMNDLLHRTISLNTTVLETRSRNEFYVKNLAVLLRNFIVVLVSSRPMTLNQMSPYLGVKEEDVKKVLDVLVNEKKVKKEGDLYKAVPKKDD
jgi:hypothetical protein